MTKSRERARERERERDLSDSMWKGTHAFFEGRHEIFSLSVIIVSKNMGRCYLNETYIIFMVLKADFEDNDQ